MYLSKGSKYCLKEMFKAAEENKRNGVSIVYIWVNKCDICGEDINVIDDEYSYYFSSPNKYCTSDQIKKDMEEYNKDYSIYEDMYEEENKDFYYMGLDELNNIDVYYYYEFDFTEKEICHICEQVWN